MEDNRYRDDAGLLISGSSVVELARSKVWKILAADNLRDASRQSARYRAMDPTLRPLLALVASNRQVRQGGACAIPVLPSARSIASLVADAITLRIACGAVIFSEEFDLLGDTSRLLHSRGFPVANSVDQWTAQGGRHLQGVCRSD